MTLGDLIFILYSKLTSNWCNTNSINIVSLLTGIEINIKICLPLTSLLSSERFTKEIKNKKNKNLYIYVNDNWFDFS